MSTLFLVAVDGSEGSQRAARFAAERARCEGAELLLVHVIEWSRYVPMTPQAIAGRHVEREKEIAAAREHVVAPVLAALGGAEARTEIHHGHAVEVVNELAEKHGATQVFTGRRGHGKLGALVFGSVSGSLVQTCPVPITVVP